MTRTKQQILDERNELGRELLRYMAFNTALTDKMTYFRQALKGSRTGITRGELDRLINRTFFISSQVEHISQYPAMYQNMAVLLYCYLDTFYEEVPLKEPAFMAPSLIDFLDLIYG